MFSKSVPNPQPSTIQPIVLDKPEVKQKEIKNKIENFGISSTIEQNFFLTLGSGEVPFDATDPTIVWQYNIPTLAPNEKKRVIQILYCGAILKNYQSHDFPNKLGIQAENVMGFQQLTYQTSETSPGWITIPTNTLAWSTISQCQSTVSSTGIPCYNVVYENSQDCPWDVGMLNVLTLRILDDESRAIPAPFNNPVNLHLRILHIGV